MSRRGWLIGIATLVVVALATTLVIVLRDRDHQSASPPEPTVWQRIQANLDDNGVMPKEGALQAFAYIFGGLPDVQVPTGRREDFSISGTSAIRGVRAYWDELTDEQRKTILRKTGLDESFRLRASGPLTRQPTESKDTARANIYVEVKQLNAKIGQLLGKTIPDPSVTLVDEEGGKDVRAWSHVISVGLGNRPTECRMFFPPSQWKLGETEVKAELKQVVAHELIHCHQGFTYPTWEQYHGAPGWLLDGPADFGASKIVGDAPAGSWRIYLNDQLPLIKQPYGAMGWWFHLDHLGHDPWKAFPKIWAAAMDSPAAYRFAGGNLDDVKTTWASSFLRNEGFGDAWVVHGLSVPSDKPPRNTVDAKSGDVSADPYAARIAVINVARSKDDVVVQLGADAPVRLHDNATFEQVRVARGTYCVGGKCVCPEKTKRAGQQIQKVAAPLVAGVDGGESGNRLTTRTMSLLEYCEREEDDKKLDEWKGKSYGEPHLTSFDGRQFDFQAGGEFTLARSESGDFEIQARQEPIRFNGKDITAVSVNTAIAAKVGQDRVGIYATADGVRVRINGEPAEVKEKRDLSGGSILPVDGDYEIHWADGSKLRTVPIGEYGLHLLVNPADGLVRKVHGMLGPFEGVDGNPTMEDRGGKRYENPDNNQLYKEIGESWRIKQADSLFDYEPGQSTETFTRRDMPSDPFEPNEDQRKKAEAACAAITDPTLNKQCVFDVAITSDPSFADSYSSLQKINSRGGLRDGATVNGEIAKADEIDSYDVTLADGQEFRIADEQGDLKFSLVGKDESTEHVEFGTIAGLTVNAFRAKAAGTYQLRVSNTFGGTGKYSFRFVMLQLQRSQAKLGEKITARLDQPGRIRIYEFDTGDARKIRVSGEDCGDIWVGVEENKPALDPGGNPACRGPVDFDVEPGKKFVLVVWSDSGKVEDFTFRLDAQ